MSKPITVTDANFKSTVLESAKPVLVDFWATWCGPCRMIAPILDEISAEEGQRLTIAKLDVDVNQGTAQAYNVMSIPTLILFKNGQPLQTFVGYKSKEQLLASLRPVIG
jgi:thioredoxin 1